jgi:hypothetical protein
MTDAQKNYIEKLRDYHELSDFDLNQIAEKVTYFPGALWAELNVKEASDVLDHILKEYGGFSDPSPGLRKTPPVHRPSRVDDYEDLDDDIPF